MVGISAIEQGVFVAGRYRVVERLTRFAVADSALTGVEYEYWLALDETRGAEVWLQIAASGDAAADAAQLSGVVAVLRRLNHPALPAVLDFGEIELTAALAAQAEAEVVDAADAVEVLGVTDVVDAQDAAGGEEEAEAQLVVEAVEEDEVLVRRVGYVVLEPVEAQSLAALLLRGALAEAEIFTVLAGIADVLTVLHEVGLVHGHLSAYSFLLGEQGVLLIDVAAAAALEVAAGSELSSAADVYALAWLACLAIAGTEAVEAEFGLGFGLGSSPESEAGAQLLTLELVERRRAWAEAKLVAAYGLRPELAALLIAALGEAAGRPAAGVLAGQLRVGEQKGRSASALGATGAAAGALIAVAVAAGAAEAAQTEVGVAELVAAVEGAEVVAEAQAVAAHSAMAGGEAGAGSAKAGGEASAAAGEVSGAAAAGETQLVGAGVGAAAGAGAQALAGAESQRGAGRGGSGRTGSGRTGSGRGGSNRTGGGGSSGAVATGLAAAPLTTTSSPSGRHGSPPRRPKSALYVAIGIVALAIGAVAWGCSAGGSSPTATPSGTPATTGQSSPGQTTGTGTGSSPSPGAGQSASAGAGSGAGASPSPSGVISPSAPVSASAGAGTGPGATPSYQVTPLATAPASPSQALQQIKQTVSHAEASGQIPRSAQGPLNQAVNTLQHEIGAGTSTQPGISQLRSALIESGVPAGFRSQINQLIPYLSAGHGS